MERMQWVRHVSRAELLGGESPPVPDPREANAVEPVSTGEENELRHLVEVVCLDDERERDEPERTFLPQRRDEFEVSEEQVPSAAPVDPVGLLGGCVHGDLRRCDAACDGSEGCPAFA